MSGINANENTSNKGLFLAAAVILTLAAILSAVLIFRHFYFPNEGESVDTSDIETTAPNDSGSGEEATETDETTEITPITGIPGIEDDDTDFVPPSDGSKAYISLESVKQKYSQTVIQAGSDAGKDYLGKLVYIGDSLTHGLEHYKVLPDENVWTPSNGTMTLSDVANKKIYFTEDKKEIPIKEALARTKPEVLVIALGVNGISWLKEEAFKNEFRSLVAEVKNITPETKIILQSILPVAPSYKNQESINNFKISRGNKWLIEVAYELGLYYMDVAECLVDETGYLPESYDSGDGLHLSASTYKIVENYIRTHSIPTKNKPIDNQGETTDAVTDSVTDKITEPETTATTEAVIEPIPVVTTEAEDVTDFETEIAPENTAETTEIIIE